MDPLRPAMAGTITWLVVLLGLLVAGDRVAAADRWWLWTAATGIVLGLAGIVWARRARAQLRATDSSTMGSSTMGSSTGSGSVSSA